MALSLFSFFLFKVTSIYHQLYQNLLYSHRELRGALKDNSVLHQRAEQQLVLCKRTRSATSVEHYQFEVILCPFFWNSNNQSRSHWLCTALPVNSTSHMPYSMQGPAQVGDIFGKVLFFFMGFVDKKFDFIIL